MKQYSMKMLFLLGFCWGGASQNLLGQKIDATLDLSQAFSPKVDQKNGIKGEVSPGGFINVTVREKKKRTILYETRIVATSLNDYAGTANTYKPKDLGQGGIYYPNPWQSIEVKNSGFGIDKYYYDQTGKINISPFLSTKIDVEIQVGIRPKGKTTLHEILIPGIGRIDAKGNKIPSDSVTSK